MILILIILLLLAILPLSYGYYILLRFLVCVGVIRELFLAPSNNTDTTISLVAIAVLYNPIIKMALGRPIWTIVNIVTALYFIFYLSNNKKQ
ncbi:MAG: DUF6804 family protein [Candidatus Gastranaerophilaceae bacterium]